MLKCIIIILLLKLAGSRAWGALEWLGSALLSSRAVKLMPASARFKEEYALLFGKYIRSVSGANVNNRSSALFPHERDDTLHGNKGAYHVQIEDAMEDVTID